MLDRQRSLEILTELPRRPGSLKRLTSMVAALDDLGWARSADGRAPVDSRGAPLPWYTYAAISWLGPRLRATDRVFEFGAGNSSLWYSARTASVISVEHDAAWADSVRTRAGSKLEVIHRPDPGDPVHAPDDHPYVRALAEIGHRPDVVVVDARARAACLRAASARVADDGLVILDNSDRTAYRESLTEMHEQGWGRIDFLGPAPGSGRLSNTSVFLRPTATRWLLADPALEQVGYDA